MYLQNERLNRLPIPIRKLIESAEQKISELEHITTGARQGLYLNAWRDFYVSYLNYISPADRVAVENKFGPRRTDDVSTESYENIKHTVQQNRGGVLQNNKERLARILLTATDPNTSRNKLAHDCYQTAERLNQYADVFADLDAQSYSPCLPPSYSPYPDRRVDEPAHVGAALGLLDFLEYALAQFWANEVPSTSTPAPASTIALDVSAPLLAAPVSDATTVADLPKLSPADLILALDFTLDEGDRLAFIIGLTNEKGHYCLGPRKLGAVVGFALALQQAGKLTGNISALTAVLAPRWGIQIATRKTTTAVAQHYFSLTNKALIRPKKTN